MEVISDLSRDVFLASLKRMIRTCLPSDIFCNNATILVAACSKLTELKAFIFERENQDVETNYCANEFFNFHFMLGHPNLALVKLAKEHLIRSVMNIKLTHKELTTALLEIEAVLK